VALDSRRLQKQEKLGNFAESRVFPEGAMTAPFHFPTQNVQFATLQKSDEHTLEAAGNKAKVCVSFLDPEY
jgi:uncharacterized protein (DUF427 family)